MITRIILIRHGEAEGNVERIFHGHYDSKITDKGYKQIQLVTNRLADLNIDAIYSSDLNRTKETVRPISEHKNLPIHEVPALREISGGQWENVPWDDLPIKFSESYDKWLNEPHLLQMPGGESMKEFQERLVDAIMNIAVKHQRKNVLISTHGTAIRALQCYFRGYPLDRYNEIEWVDNTALTVIDIYSDGSCKMVVEGDSSHLGEHGTIEYQEWYINRKK